MLIALEGVDGGGKSTLARALLDSFEGRGEIWHQGPPPPNRDLVEWYERPLTHHRDEILDPDTLIVMDRWETGELVYGPLLRGESRLSRGQALHVDLVLRSLGAVRCLVQPDDAQTVLDRHDERGDDLVKREWLIEIFDFYREYARDLDWVRVNRCAWPDARLLIAVARQRCQAARMVGRFPGYTGHLPPRVLLVGERRADGPGAISAPWTNHAFTPLGRLSCGQWLLDGLDQLRETDVGLVNAHEPGIDLVRLHQALSEPVVIALGNAASAELTRVGVGHGKVPHPQWARRFRHADGPSGYARLIIQEMMKERESGVREADGVHGSVR